MDTILVPSSLLYKEEVEFIEKSGISLGKVKNPELKCSIYKVPENQLSRVIANSADRALALRIVSKALQLGNGKSSKPALLAVSAALASWAPNEADRILRSI